MITLRHTASGHKIELRSEKDLARFDRLGYLARTIINSPNDFVGDVIAWDEDDEDSDTDGYALFCAGTKDCPCPSCRDERGE